MGKMERELSVFFEDIRWLFWSNLHKGTRFFSSLKTNDDTFPQTLFPPNNFSLSSSKLSGRIACEETFEGKTKFAQFK